MDRNYWGKEKDEEVGSYISDQQKHRNNPKPEYAICVNGSHFIAVDHLLFPCSDEYAKIAEHFSGTMNVEYHSGVTITKTVPPLDDEYRELIKLLSNIDTNRDEREIGRDLVGLLNQKGIPCEYQGHGIDIWFRKPITSNYYSDFKSKGCELKKKFPSNVRNMYLEFYQLLKYLRQGNLLSCLLLNVQSGEYFRVSKFYLGKPIEESINIASRIRYAIGGVCDSCYFRIFTGDNRGYGCSYPRCPAYKLRDFSSESLELDIKWVGNRLLLRPRDDTIASDRFLDISDGKWVSLDSENHIIKEDEDDR